MNLTQYGTREYRHRPRILWLVFFLAVGLATTLSAQEKADSPEGLNVERLSPIAEAVEEEIRAGNIPGAVVLVGQGERVVYRRAFGHRAIEPRKLPMKADTIFDLSSLTKGVATTTAVMQLVEKGKLRLGDPVANYWPEFKANGKEKITVCELLTHYSGLRSGLDLASEWSGYAGALRMVVAEKPIYPPGTRFVYSDINFIILGELVHRISGKSLEAYCRANIFKPLGMKDTGFKPPPDLYNRLASTRPGEDKSEKEIGAVHDPIAYKMGGVAGHAGLFSTADDLAIFARALLGISRSKTARILSPLTIEKMISPQNPPDKMAVRGLGWDIDSPFASNRGELFPIGSFGHTGYTGTSLWMDTVSQTYIILLTNRVHPWEGDAGPLRAKVATIVAAALGPSSAEKILSSRRSLTGYFELMKNFRISGLRNGKVLTGIDVLQEDHFASLAGLRVGLITNHTGIDSAGLRTIDLLFQAPGVKLAAIFVPEHGLAGNAEGEVPFSRDLMTALPCYSLYGGGNRPTEEMLEGLNALVFDVQDAGVRFYTYVTTMAYAMEAAAAKGMAFYVLDRPNPISGSLVQGPILDGDLKSFTGYFPLPIRHGMSVGELAQMFNAESGIGVELHVIKMKGYERSDWYDETGLPWISPSPNLRTLTATILYPGVAVVEGANVSVGRGTSTPFEILGAPWIDARELAVYLNARKIQGARFMPMDFTPSSDRFENQTCHGVQISLTDRQALDSPALGLEIVCALYNLYPRDFQLDSTLPLIGSREVLQDIHEGRDPEAIIHQWQGPLARFLQLRAKYLLY